MKPLYFLVFLFALASFDSAACSCRKSDPNALISQSDNVLIGRVTKLEMKTDESGEEYQKVTLSNAKTYKGNSSPVLYSYFDGSFCRGNRFELGVKHIVFLDEKNWTTGYCGGTRAIYSGNPETISIVEALNKLSTNKTLN
ncbi:hypothetical protein CW748_10745 [Alteromonadales bacterium alter-6D02]|nr:hypothetical protein CW748_10745 [Alteromonadales bacterium alter-6D02]